MFLTNNPFSDHGPSKQVLSEAFKYHIPEDIPAHERTAFHGAAAAAAKQGKKNFNFGGKTHPVTMKKDTANAITSMKHHNKDDKMKKEMAEPMSKKKEKKEALDKKDVKTVKGVIKGLKKAVATHSGQVKTLTKDIKDDVKKESTMTFREKLISVLEGDRAAHYKSATTPEGMLDKSQSSKGAMDMVKGAQDKIKSGADLDIKKSIDDNEKAKADKKMKQSKKRSSGDNVASGDRNIKPSATPIKDPTAKMESVIDDKYGIFGKTMNELLDAVNKVIKKKD